MSKVWRRLQRVGKKATKYRFTTYSHSLKLTCDSKWQPDKLCIVWSRRGRQNSSQLAQWEPGLKNVYEGSCVWDKASGVIEFDVTLYKSLNDNKYEEKEWSLLIENEDSKGKRRLLASAKVNLNEYAQSLEPIHQVDIKDLGLKCETSKVKSSSISFSLACQFIKDGKATDEDMMSIASFMSVASTSKNPYLDSNAIRSKQVAKDAKFKDLTRRFNSGLDSRLDLDDDDDDDDGGGGGGGGDGFDFKSDNSDDEERFNDPDYYLKLQAKNEQMNRQLDSISQNFHGTVDFQTSFIKSIDKYEPPEPPKKPPSSSSLVQKPSPTHAKPVIKQHGGRLEKLVNDSFNSSNLDSSAMSASSKSGGLNTSSTLISSRDSANSTALVSPPSLSSSGKKAPAPQPPQQQQQQPPNPFLEVSKIPAESSNPFLEVSGQEDDPAPRPPRDNNKKKAPLPPSQSKPDLAPSKKILTSTFSAHNIDPQPTNTTNDLLVWCRESVDHFKKSPRDSLQFELFHRLAIDDFSASWRDGLAFCALIYHFRPSLINLNELRPDDATRNLRQAFGACDAENIGRCIDYVDIVGSRSLDKLIVMTFLYQLRDHFDAKSIVASSTFLSSCNADKSLATVAAADTTVQSLDSLKSSSVRQSPPTSKATSKPAKPASISASTPIKAAGASVSSPGNPFEENDDGKESEKAIDKNNNKSTSGLIKIKADGRIADANEKDDDDDGETAAAVGRVNSRKKRQLPQPPSSAAAETKAPMDSEQLYEKAKQLIERNKLQQQKSISREEEIKKLTKHHSRSKPEAPRFNPSQLDAVKQSQALESPVKPEASIMKLLNGEDMDENLGNEYINQEIANLKKEQDELDERGDYLEKQLRRVMGSHEARSPATSDEKQKIRLAEDNLLKEWFLLVNKRNALLHRQQELELLQNEKNLERRSELLSEQLRKLMAIDDFIKTNEQKSLEKILFNELINLVNKRNELVVMLDEENKLMNEEEQINEFIQNKSEFLPQEKQGCSIQ